MAKSEYDESEDRYRLFIDTLLNVRSLVGDIRLTTMKIKCSWCGKDRGEKEGNGAVGETSTICPECFQKQMAESAVDPCAHVAAALMTAKEETPADGITEGLRAMMSGSIPPPLFGTETDGVLLMETIREELQPQDMRYLGLTS